MKNWYLREEIANLRYLISTLERQIHEAESNKAIIEGELQAKIKRLEEEENGISTDGEKG